MKRHWLRGVLLGVSLALFLAGGVALAQGINITTDPVDCLECSTRAAHNYLSVSSSGWLDNETISYHAWFYSHYVGYCPHCGQAVNGRATDTAFVSVYCPGEAVPHEDDFFASVSQMDEVGLYRFSLVGDTSGREGFFWIRVAEVCEEEFVPEAGTVVLLGSGLAGLAGYATLRWRRRG